MHIEISAGGLSGGIAVSSFQSGMKKYISGTDGMISSFKAVRTATYNLNGGVDRLAGTVNQVTARERTEENRKSGAEDVQFKANSFLDLAVRVDKQVESMVNQDRKELYGQYPSLKPSPGQWVKDRLSDAWNWLCKAGKDIANAVERLDNLVYATLKKIGDSIVTFWKEHWKQIVISVVIIATTALLVLALIGSGGLAAPAMAAAVAAFFHISTALATKVVLTAVAITVVSAAMNLWSTWGGAGSDSWLFGAIQTTLNVAVMIIGTFTIVVPTKGLGMVTLIKDGATGITKLVGGNVAPKAIESFAKVLSKFIGYGGLTATTGGGLMTIADAWFNIQNDEFRHIQETLTKIGNFMTALYGIGLTYKTMKTAWQFRKQQKAADVAARKYNENKHPYETGVKKGVKGLKKTANGGVSFEDSPSLYVDKNGNKAIVDIQATGSRTQDFEAAIKKAKAMGIDIPDNYDAMYTWHHLDTYDVKTNTMRLELVESGAHKNTTPHSGACAQYQAAHGVKYK